MNNKPYALLSSWGRPNMQNREWLAQTEDDKEAILTNENMVAGDKVYVIESKARYVLGLDLKWHNTKAGGSANLENVEVEYTANDTYTLEPSSGYDGIGSAEITVNVQGGGGSNEPTVFLYDYDGTVIASYTPSQFAALSAYPAAPVHEGLTFQEYNWPLATAKEYVEAYGRCEIGATYITSDGKTRLYIKVYTASEITLYMGSDGDTTIDWGDGISSTVTGGSTSDINSVSHQYDSAIDNCVVTITPPGSDSITLMLGSENYSSFIDVTKDVKVTKIELGPRVSFGENAFKSRCGINSIVLPMGISEIPSSSFDGCAQLSHLTLPRGITTIHGSAFSCAYNLESVSLPPTITDMSAYYIFNQCCSLRYVTLPPLITYTGDDMFYGCYSLITVTLPEGITSLGDELFLDCTSLTFIRLPSTFEGGGNTFNGCMALRSLIIPEGATVFPHIYEDTRGLNSIIIPSTVEYIDEYQCIDSHLKTIDIPSSVVRVGEYAFNGSNLISATIAAQEVGNYAFANCERLQNVTLSSSVTQLGDGIFECYEPGAPLTIRFEGLTPPTATDYTFDGLPDSIILVPQGSLSDYTSAENYPDPSTYTYVEYAAD